MYIVHNVNLSELKDYLTNTELCNKSSPTRISAAASSPKLAETHRIFQRSLLMALASLTSSTMCYEWALPLTAIFILLIPILSHFE